MTPLAPLRMLLLGLMGWTVLGVGLYLAYDAYQTLSAVELPVAPVQRSSDGPLEPGEVVEQLRPRVPNPNRVDWGRWTSLILAVLCLGFTLGGRWPTRLIFAQGNPNVPADDPTVAASAASFCIERPDGSRLHGSVYSETKRLTLVLTHGWSLDSQAWKYLLPSLVKEYRVVTWDLPGLGKSQGPENNDYSLEKMSHDLAAVIKETCPAGPVILVGHSIGGMIQQTYCRTHADSLNQQVRGMVLVHTTYTNPLCTNIAAAVTRPLQPFIAILNQSLIVLEPFYWVSNWQSYLNGSAHWAARWESFSGRQSWEQLDFSAWKGAAAAPSVIARGNSGMLKFDEQATLPSVTIPALVISGANDRLTVPSASSRIEELLPDDRTHQDQGGHLGHIEYAVEVSQAIVEFAGSLGVSS